MADLFYNLGKKVGKSLIKGKFVVHSIAGSKDEALLAEYKFGSLLAREIEEQYSLFESPFHQLLLDSILKKLITKVKNKNRVFHVIILNSDDLNAFALPGGFIFVTSGLIKLLQNEEAELAFVIAHEMIHIIAKHPFKRMVAHFSLATINRVLKTGSPIKILGKDLLKKLFTSQYSQSNEFYADEFGLRLMYSAGFDPLKALSLLERFQNLKSPQSTFHYFSTHPSLEVRLQRLRRLIKQ